MVEFLSLLLGLVTGVRHVELNVVGSVAQVEIRIDGEAVEVLDGPPWRLSHDFGHQLLPHELVAVARDARGGELDRAVQWINIDQGSAEAGMAMLADSSGKPEAVRLDWESVGQRQPRRIEVLFDGEPLTFEDPRRIPLPSYELEDFHFVEATVEFSDESVSHLEAGFGGALGAELSTELTAVVVALGKRQRMPPAKKLAGWLEKGGEALAVHGVEKSVPEVVIVRHPDAQPMLDRLAQAAYRNRHDPNPGPRGMRPAWDPAFYFADNYESLLAAGVRQRPNRGQLEAVRAFARLGKKTDLRFLSPVVAPVLPSGVSPEIFLHSDSFTAAQGGFGWLTHQVPPMRFEVASADAVAVAGMVAHAGNRRRAVVLLQGPGEDLSRHAVVTAREYLRVLQVPLFVWRFGTEDEVSAWGEVTYLGDFEDWRRTAGRLEEAVEQLVRELRRQRVVWLEGRHLPQSVELSPAAGKVRWAGRRAAPRTGAR